MKKELFERWHESYADEFFPKDYVVNDLSEKERRLKSRKMFSSVYDLVMESMNKKLSIIDDEIDRKIENLKRDREAFKRTCVHLEDKKKRMCAEMKVIYDSFASVNEGNELLEKSVKKHYGCMLTELNTLLRNARKTLFMLKRKISMIEGLKCPSNIIYSWNS